MRRKKKIAILEANLERVTDAAVDEQYKAAIYRATRDSYWRLAETLNGALAGLLDNEPLEGEHYKKAVAARMLYDGMKRNRGGD